MALAGCTNGPSFGGDAVECEGIGDNRTCTAPVLTVTAQGPSSEQAETLGEALNVSGDSLEVSDDGGVRFVAPDSILPVPMEDASSSTPSTPTEDEEATETRAFDRAAIAELDPPSREEARQLFASALDEADLDTDGDVVASHGVLTIGDPTGSSTDHTIDTSVAVEARKNGLPVEGPGATVQVSLDHEGDVGLLLYEMREVESGSSVEIHPPEDGDAFCRDALGDERTTQNEVLETVESELVYYAPPQELTSVSKLVPHFRCSATLTNGAQVRPTFVPATVEAPEVEVTASAQTQDGDAVVSAEAQTIGGASPFSYTWSSEATTLDPDQASGGDSIQYTVEGREDADTDRVSVTVVDADGLMFQAVDTVDLPSAASGDAVDDAGAHTPAGLHLSQPTSGNVGHGDVGAATEWLGSAAQPSLGGSSGNAAGWYREHTEAGTTMDFHWGNGNAWERDFKDPSNGGNDRDWVDDTDYAWFTGHASATGWNFPTSRDDGKLDTGDAAYGEKDIEWLTIAACGPLQDRSQDTVWDRWGSAFQGLHILTGYASLSQDNTEEGETLANLLHGDYADLGIPYNGPGLSVVDSWYLTAKKIQPDNQYTLAMMGVIGQNDVTNWNDHFHGEGPVGPDIVKAEQVGYWVYRAST